MEPRTPDNVCHIEDTAVLQPWTSVSRSHQAGNALDPGCRQVLGLRSHEWHALGKDFPRRLPTYGRIPSQHAVKDEPKQYRYNNESRNRAIDAEWNMAS